jgi:hypothetical protein
MRRHLQQTTLIALLAITPSAILSASDPVPRESRLPSEQVSPATCPAESCLIIEPDSTYCSIDPPGMRDGQIFASKAELQLPSGTYPLTGCSALPNFPIRLATAAGTRTLEPAESRLSVHRETPDPETRVAPLEWIEVRSDLAADALAGELFLRTSRWPHEQFRLGDPEDVRWFFEAARNLLLRVADGGALFPGLAAETIFFAPCAMRDLPDRMFRFAFADGSALDLRVRAISGAHQIGYYMGRLLEARGRLAGQDVHVTDRNNLVFFGSTRSWAEMAIPSLAVRTQSTGRICGVLLDSAEWDTAAAVNGYVAYELTCDERRGRRLSLRDVSYPDAFTLP